MGDVTELFKNKPVINKDEAPEEIIARFHAKLDQVLDEFPSLTPFEKYEVMESVALMNKNIFQLYFDMKKRLDYKEKYE
jgi:hypothetical protein